ncbi:uncharacterized protein PV09_05422 [Verruconis gallopava]|uniref:ATPase synthesis protein 25 n=1 Tax=Verruconis gallopava TaxID=253628 RepID=A0A0D1XLA7_9PEZI|nr:uncharacterized protein PV09_05422 [Verruconis gallopava]KIW03196.1 hypothetical protein PV09_05422 [Verruconis gallopava]
MALARVFCRPLWTCKSCRTSCVRAFATTNTNELPRRPRRWQDLAPYKADTERSYDPTSVAELSNFEEDAFDKRSESSQAPTKSARTSGETDLLRANVSKPFRTDGISNLSNKTPPQQLSIPPEFVDETESNNAFEHQRHQPSIDFQEQQNATQDDPVEKPMSDLPWYLQPQHQRPISTEPSGSMADRQKVPDLPIHAPPQLEPILQNLSVEIGLDFLKILDLRELDPPPALGRNLIMVIGTVRSEKHLTVAATRFCAWLRREYNMTPSADGLLGRNELKIKQKRKAKKARAFANAGALASSIEDLDDGISTGWICVHSGFLEPHPDAPLKEVKRVNGMIGFGEENNKVTLVVQMFTEERRAQIDLEGLWEGVLERNLRKRQQSTTATVESDVDSEKLKENEDEDEALTLQELEARKKFKLGDKTVLDNINLESQEAVRSAPQAA